LTTDPLPADPEEHDDKSLFDDFINRSLDLDGLDENAWDEDEEEGALDFDDPNSVIFRFHLPGGMLDNLKQNGSNAYRNTFLRLPMKEDVRWQDMVMTSRPGRLKIAQPRFDYLNHDGEMTLPLTPKSTRRIRVVHEVMPGWSAVSYVPGRGTEAAFTEKVGGRVVAHHHLHMGGKDLSGFVKTDELPALRPARLPVNRLQDTLTYAQDVLIVALIALAVFYLGLRIFIGDPAADGRLVERIATLEAQVQALEGQFVPDEAPMTP
jgi:hypothetical protein